MILIGIHWFEGAKAMDDTEIMEKIYVR